MPDFELLVAAGFEWDEIKSGANLIKHGISFDDASDIFYGPIIIRQIATMRSVGLQ
jgi:uncharacterized DUF497 family protein